MGAPRTPTLPGALRGSTALLIAAAAVALWRFGGFPIAAAGALVALVVSWRAGEWLHGDRRWVAAFACMPAAVALLLALSATGTWPQAWPCAIACQGGARYEQIHGVPLPAIACVGWIGLLLMVGATRWAPPQIEHRRSAPTPRYLELLVWIAIGASLFFVWTAWRLRMPCSACGAYHTAALSVGGTLRAGRLRLLPRWLALAAGAAAPILVFGWHLLSDIEPVLGAPAPQAASGWSGAATRGLTLGRPDAPLVLSLLVDLQCSGCAEDVARLDEGLGDLVADHELKVELILVRRPSEPAGGTLDAWVCAAAVHGRAWQAIRSLSGTRPDATIAEVMRSPAAGLLDLKALADEAGAHRAAVDVLLDGFARRRRQLAYDGQAPFGTLSDHGAVIGRWSDRVDAQLVAQAIKRRNSDGASHE